MDGPLTQYLVRGKLSLVEGSSCRYIGDTTGGWELGGGKHLQVERRDFRWRGQEQLAMEDSNLRWRVMIDDF